MRDLLLLPGAPFFALSAALACLLAYGLTRMEGLRLALAGYRAQPSLRAAGRRWVVGQTMGAICAAVALLVLIVAGYDGMAWWLLVSLAGASYLFLGVVVPRRPMVQAQREAAELRRLTPGFVSYVMVSLAGYDSPIHLLQRYCARAQPRLAPMQALIAEALTLMQARRLRPFEALRVVARARSCQELIDIAEALAQAEAEGGDVLDVLEGQRIVLQQVLRDEFTRMLKRRTLYLILMVAISLVVGILINLLFIMTAGGSVITSLIGQ